MLTVYLRWLYLLCWHICTFGKFPCISLMYICWRTTRKQYACWLSLINTFKPNVFVVIVVISSEDTTLSFLVAIEHTSLRWVLLQSIFLSSINVINMTSIECALKFTSYFIRNISYFPWQQILHFYFPWPVFWKFYFPWQASYKCIKRGPQILFLPNVKLWSLSHMFKWKAKKIWDFFTS